MKISGLNKIGPTNVTVQNLPIRMKKSGIPQVILDSTLTNLAILPRIRNLLIGKKKSGVPQNKLTNQAIPLFIQNMLIGKKMLGVPRIILDSRLKNQALPPTI